MNTNNLPVEIDFLPAESRKSHTRLKSQSRRLAVTGILAILVVAGVATQYLQRQRLEAEQALIVPMHETAARQAEQLAALQAELSGAQADAELFTYLRYPWPRTRILQALLVPLPAEVTLEQLQIEPENMPERSRGTRSADKAKISEEELKKLPPAVQDLRQLRQQCDRQQTVVTFSGVTAETRALHRYLGELAKARLFSKAELTGIEAESGDRGSQTRFRARVIVRPGYGQPGGPDGPETEAVAASQVSSTN